LKLVCFVVVARSGRPGSSVGRPGTASRPPVMKTGAGGKRCSILSGLYDVVIDLFVCSRYYMVDIVRHLALL